jgi:hypothetical protein
MFLKRAIRPGLERLNAKGLDPQRSRTIGHHFVAFASSSVTSMRVSPFTWRRHSKECGSTPCWALKNARIRPALSNPNPWFASLCGAAEASFGFVLKVPWRSTRGHHLVQPVADLVAADPVAAEGRSTVNFAFVFSLVIAGLAVVGVFIEIPMVSNYAFWFAIGAYIILASSRV